MLKLLTAMTTEMDDVAAAINEIFAQLDLPSRQLKNSAAIVVCHRDFIDSEVAAAVLEKLSAVMPVIGGTSHCSGHNAGENVQCLTVGILTGDEVKFGAASGEISEENYAAEIAEIYRTARKKIPSEPTLILAIEPFSGKLNGDILTDALTASAGDIPVFGAIASTMPPTPETIFVFGDTKISSTRMSVMLISGVNQPEFYSVVAATDADKTSDINGIVTSAHGNLLYEVDRQPAEKFFARCGVTANSLLLGLPVMFDFQDGSRPVATGMINITPKCVTFNKEVKVGVQIAPTSFLNRETVLATADIFIADLAKKISARDNPVIIAISCLARTLSLLPDEDAEMKKFRTQIGSMAPYMIFYGGGELCPVPIINSHQTVNRFHHYTWSVLVLS